MSSLAKEVRKIRQGRNSSKAELAAKSGMTTDEIRAIESGQYGRPDPDKLERLARALNTDPQQLVH